MAIVETNRLTLRKMTFDDLDFIHSIVSDPETMRFYPAPYDLEGSKTWVRRTLERYEEHGCAFYVVCDKKSQTPLGQVGILMQTVHDKLLHEVGYLMHRSYWRNGFASEAAIACRDLAFRDFSAPVVHSIIHPDNIPSQGVARKMGMQPYPDLVEFHGGEFLLFHITRDEWTHLTREN